MTTAATCTEDGVKTYTCKICGLEKTETVPKTGHDWSDVEYERSDDYSEVTASRVCNNDESHKETETQKSVVKSETETTCTEDGKAVYMSMFVNPAFEMQTETVVTKASGHMPASQPVIENKVEATCTEAGSYDTVVYCTTCNEEISRTHETIDATGHDWGDWIVTKEPTVLTTGLKQRVCNNDSSHIEIEVIPVLGGTKPTCVLSLSITGKGNKSLVFNWSKVSDADGYDIYMAPCNTKGKKNKLKKVKTIKGNLKFTWTKKGLKKHTSYKAYARAWTLNDGIKVYGSKSLLMHSYTGGYKNKNCNVKSIKLKKSKITLKAGKTFKIKGTVRACKKNKKLFPASHVPKFRYITSDKTIATVTSKGRVKAVSKGTCKVYVYAHNGKKKVVKVTVKG